MEEIKSKFEGNWECIKKENVEKFLEAMGVNLIKRKAAAQFNPKLSISVGDGCVKVVRKMPIKEITNEFKLDDEIDVKDDDHKYKAKLTYSGGKMTLCLRAVDGKSKDNTIVREIEGDNLVQTATCNGVTAKTTFKKC
uniref:Fatty acid-binding protein, intestinal n=1 Tax=Magallana gigas TaxID=29159 RepID=K1RIH6_MAGGI|eukprot:XP_011446262.1 PREDICTED: fatty acid-binding protein, intestinal isoform X1 [Crassostrea gigas]